MSSMGSSILSGNLGGSSSTSVSSSDGNNGGDEGGEITCESGFVLVDGVCVEDIPGCETVPGYTNATFTTGTVLTTNTPWQNTSSGSACYFECINGTEWDSGSSSCKSDTSSTVLLMHFDGNYNDSAGKISGATGTNVGLTITGAFSKFGGYSLVPNVSSQSFLKVPEPTNSLLNFGGGNFTIDFFLYPSNNTVGSIYGKRTDSAGVHDGILIIQELGPKIRILSSYNNTGWDIDFTVNSILTVGSWNHIAVVRNGTELSVYINGIKNIVTSSLGTLYYWNNVDATIGSSSLAGASYPQYQGYNGYIDEFRIIKGKAVRTENFTPPTAPY